MNRRSGILARRACEGLSMEEQAATSTPSQGEVLAYILGRLAEEPAELRPLVSELVGAASQEQLVGALRLFAENVRELQAAVRERMTEAQLDRLLQAMVHFTANVGLSDHDRSLRLFDIAQAMGVHFLRSHFYSVVPDTSKLDSAMFKERFDGVRGGVDPRTEAQLELLGRLRGYSSELEDVPEQAAPPDAYGWVNPAFYPYDAAVLYCMVREFKPRRIIEIGCGHSTMINARALAANGGGELICVEPYPQDFLRGIRGVSEVIEKPVQEVPQDLYDSLGEDDLLFIDSTHVCRVGSDVNHLFLRVLPSLARGVWVHVHDIYLPFEMPEDWVRNKKIFWNEQYLLQAFMLCNDSFRPLLMNNFLGIEHPEAMRAAFACVPSRWRPGGGSYYMQRVK